LRLTAIARPALFPEATINFVCIALSFGSQTRNQSRESPKLNGTNE